MPLWIILGQLALGPDNHKTRYSNIFQTKRAYIHLKTGESVKV